MGNFAGSIHQHIPTHSPDIESIVAKQEQEVAAQETAQQAELSESLKNVFEEAANPTASRFQSRQKNLGDNKVRLTRAEQLQKEKKIVGSDQMKQSAEKFEKRNPELKAQILRVLADRIKDATSKEEILKILEQFYPDPATADDALQFLLEVTVGDLQKLVQEARDELNAKFGREIKAGKNISDEVLKFSSQGIGAPKTLRDLYRDITGNPREPSNLFLELADRYQYKELRKVLAFLFHSMGADLKSQGPSIQPGLLHRLFTEVRSLQAILGVYQFFRARMKLIQFLFKREGFEIPNTLNFETLAKSFVQLLQERYPSADKILQLANKFNIAKELVAKIIVFSQLRDGIREISLNKFYRSLEHRNDLYNAILEALEQLEDELERIEEDEEENSSGKEEEDQEKDQKKQNNKKTAT